MDDTAELRLKEKIYSAIAELAREKKTHTAVELTGDEMMFVADAIDLVGSMRRAAQTLRAITL